MTQLLQVGNLPNSIDRRLLERLFALHGPVSTAQVSVHRDTGLSTGAGFVEMASEDGCTAAIAALNGHEYLGSILSVCRCDSPQNRPIPRNEAIV